MTPKNDLPVQYPSAMTDAAICQDLYARSFMYSALIQMLVERLRDAAECVKELEGGIDSENDSLRSEIDDLEADIREKDKRILELENEADGMQTRIDDLEAELAR